MRMKIVVIVSVDRLIQDEKLKLLHNKKGLNLALLKLLHQKVHGTKHSGKKPDLIDWIHHIFSGKTRNGKYRFAFPVPSDEGA